MKPVKLVLVLTFGLILCACGRSKQPEFYILNPISPKLNSVKQYTFLKIGVDAIHTPAYTEKPQVMIYDSLNRVQLEEFHQWAESLDKNIKSVIKANLNTLLPGVVMEDAPWDIEFKPTYNLQIDISEIKIDRCGNSSLRANYIVSSQGHIIKKYERYYHLKVPVVTVENLIKSMNANLNAFTSDIAHTFIVQKNQVK